MAVASNPTVTELVKQAIQQALYVPGTVLYATVLAEGTGQWAQEVKSEIVSRIRSLKNLETSAFFTVQAGNSYITLPSDLNRLSTVKLLSGTVPVLAQTGGAGDITLAATESTVDNSLRGLEILITEGTGVGQLRQLIDYDGTTKISNVHEAWTVVPNGTSKYMVVNKESNLVELYSDITYNSDFDVMTPQTFQRFGGDNAGKLRFASVPDTTYGLKVTYFADLALLDLQSTLLSTMYMKYRLAFLEGLYVRALRRRNAKEYFGALSVYKGILKNLKSSESKDEDTKDLTMYLGDE